MKALAPVAGSWSALLTLFEPEVRGAVSRMSGRLDALLGVPRERPFVGAAEPDGYSGFTRHGRYERLLLSEWLLAEDAPDEFLRRAASGEHAFHELARRDPSSRRTLLVLLDAGPEQVGAPRLAHIAALVSLDRRARRAGATLAWAMLGHPTRPFATAVDPVSFAGFVASHTDRAPSSDGAQRAVASAEGHGPFAEVWLVGSKSILSQAPVPSAHFLLVEEAFDPERRALELTVASKSGAGRSVTLDLPDPRIAIRMLRDPFAVRPPSEGPSVLPPATASRFDLLRPFYLVPSGRRLLGLDVDGAAVSLPVPDVPSDKARSPHVVRAERGETIIAVGVGTNGRRLAAVGIAGSELVLHIDKRPMRSPLGEGGRALAWLLDDGPALLAPIDESGRRFLLLHRKGSFELHGGSSWEVRTSSAVAITMHRGARGGVRTPTFVTSVTPNGASVGPVMPLSGDPSLVMLDALPAPVTIFSATPQTDGSFVAVRESADGTFATFRRPQVGADPPREAWRRIRLADEDVVGLVAGARGPAFVAVRGRDTLVVRAFDSSVIFERTFMTPIRHVACASAAAVVAVATSYDRIHVIDVERKRALVTLEAGPR